MTLDFRTIVETTPEAKISNPNVRERIRSLLLQCRASGMTMADVLSGVARSLSARYVYNRPTGFVKTQGMRSRRRGMRM